MIRSFSDTTISEKRCSRKTIKKDLNSVMALNSFLSKVLEKKKNEFDAEREHIALVNASLGIQAGAG